METGTQYGMILFILPCNFTGSSNFFSSNGGQECFQVEEGRESRVRKT